MTKLAFSRPSQGEQTAWLFENFRNFGYEGLQLKTSQYRDYLTSPAELHRLGEKYPGVNSAVIGAVALSPEGLNSIEELGTFAATAGCEMLIVHCATHSPGWRDAVPGLGRIATRLKGEGVALSLHNHYGEFPAAAEDMRWLYAQPDTNDLTLTIDTAHIWANAAEDTAEIIDEFHAVIDNIHLKDCSLEAAADHAKVRDAPRGLVRFRRLGFGAMDFDSIFAAIRKTGYSGWLCIDEESGDDMMLGLTESVEYLRAASVLPAA